MILGRNLVTRFTPLSSSPISSSPQFYSSIAPDVNPRIRTVRESATLKINQKVKKMRSENPNEPLTHFGFGQSPFPVPEQVQEMVREHAGEKDYLPTQGHPRLCEAVASYYRKQYNLNHFSASDVFVGPGSKELLYHLLYILQGDLLLPSPSWVSYGPQAELLGKEIVPVSTLRENGYRVSALELQKSCQNSNKGQKVLILNSPNNPTGSIYSDQELKDIASVCQENQIITISDEIYAGVHFSNATSEHSSLSHFHPSGTIVTGGLSKLFAAGGYRLGVALIPSEFQEVCNGLRVIISETFSCVSGPIQWAAIKAYEDYEELVPYLTTCNKIHEYASRYLHYRFTKMGLECPEPMGAFYLLPTFDAFGDVLAKKFGVTDSEGLANWLLDEVRVAALPGNDFNLPSKKLGLRVASVDYDGREVVDFVMKNGNEKLLSVGRDGKFDEDFVGKCMPQLKAGCDRMEATLSKLK